MSTHGQTLSCPGFDWLSSPTDSGLDMTRSVLLKKSPLQDQHKPNKIKNGFNRSALLACTVKWANNGKSALVYDLNITCIIYI